MRGKTRNLLENIIAFAIFLSLLYGIYYLIAKYTGLEKIFSLDEVEQFVEKYVDKNDSRVKSLYVIKENDLDQNDTNNSIMIEENVEVTEETTTKIVKEKVENKPIAKKIEPKENKKEVVKYVEKPKIKKEEIVREVEKKKVILEEENQEIEDEKKITSNEDTTENKETDKPTKKTILSAENLQKFSIINKFIRTTKEKINDSIENYGIEYEKDSPVEVNIRITVLKDGSFQHLVLSNGDREYFDLITPAIEYAFPIEIDERIEDQFPRYFRMTITKDK